VELKQETFFGLVVIIILAVLLFFGKIDVDRFFQLVFLIVGAILGVAYGYYRAMRKLTVNLNSNLNQKTRYTSSFQGKWKLKKYKDPLLKALD